MAQFCFLFSTKSTDFERIPRRKWAFPWCRAAFDFFLSLFLRKAMNCFNRQWKSYFFPISRHEISAPCQHHTGKKASTAVDFSHFQQQAFSILNIHKLFKKITRSLWAVEILRLLFLFAAAAASSFDSNEHAFKEKESEKEEWEKWDLCCSLRTFFIFPCKLCVNVCFMRRHREEINFN